MTEIKNNYLIAEINELGAQLSRLASKSTEYIWDGNPDIWPKHAPVLFPFCGRLQDQKFGFEGKEYGPMTLHGFAPYASFTECDKKESSVRMKMIVSEEIKAIWPFDFEFSVFYELVEKTLKVTYEVYNKDKKVMYYGMGSHPGFNVPITQGLSFEDYFVYFPEASEVKRNLMTEVGLNSGKQEVYTKIVDKKLKLEHNLFDQDAVILSNTGSRAVIKTDKDNKSIEVEYPDTKYCAVWHKKKDKVPFLCIEPWTSLPGWDGKLTELETYGEYNKVSPGETKKHRLNITINE